MQSENTLWNRSAHALCRRGTVRLFLGAVVVVGLLGSSIGMQRAQSATLGFDPPGLTATTSYALVPNGYGGLNWSNFDYMNGNYLPGSGYQHGVVSTPNVAFNDFGNPAEIDDPTGFFNFDSADLTAAWIPTPPGLNITVEGFNTNFNATTPLYTRTVAVNTAGPTLYTFDAGGLAFVGINKLEFIPFINGDTTQNPAAVQFAMDNFSFTTTPNGSVPEPSSMLLATMGLGGLWIAARRKNRTRTERL